MAKVSEALYIVELEYEGDISLSINSWVPLLLQGALKPITCAAKYILIELHCWRFCLSKLSYSFFAILWNC